MMKERDWIVQVKTGSVCAIDDVVVAEDDKPEEEDAVMDGDGGKIQQQLHEEDTDDIPETRIRFTSMIEIEVRLRTDDAIIT